MWVRKILDIAWIDLFFAFFYCLIEGDEKPSFQSIVKQWNSSRPLIACLSVRSGFDLFLKVINLPLGCEVLVTALTIPDMITIIESHGLVPVSLDLASDTLYPDINDILSKITPKTKMILVAQLLGGINDLRDILEVASSNNLYVVEDCAQAFTSLSMQGHAQADVSMFSFGSIKTATCLGGAILFVKNNALYLEMLKSHQYYPFQKKSVYFKKIIKHFFLKILSIRLTNKCLHLCATLLSVDIDKFISSSVKGFPGKDLLVKLRHKPSIPLLRLMARRFRTYNYNYIEHRQRCGNKFRSNLSANIKVLGDNITQHSFWVFPVCSSNPENLVKKLRKHNFDATQISSMQVYSPENAKSVSGSFSTSVFIPVYPEMTEPQLLKLAQLIKS